MTAPKEKQSNSSMQLLTTKSNLGVQSSCQWWCGSLWNARLLSMVVWQSKEREAPVKEMAIDLLNSSQLLLPNVVGVQGDCQRCRLANWEHGTPPVKVFKESSSAATVPILEIAV